MGPGAMEIRPPIAYNPSSHLLARVLPMQVRQASPRIAAPPSEKVFAFHEIAGRRPERLTPPWEKVRAGGRRRVDQARHRASTLQDQDRADPAPTGSPSTPSTTRPACSPTASVSGPFASRGITAIEFMEDDGQGGTILRDVVDYEVPLGALGRLLGGGLVRSKLNKMFDFRHEATRKIVESGDFPGA